MTPLHIAAESGQLSVCQLIISNIEDKNPKATYGMTSFHIAAENDIVYLHRVFFQISSKSNLKSKVAMICRCFGWKKGC